MVRAATPPRNLELEAAIVADPDDLTARMVYGDWLQGQGDPRGEWAAMMARVEADPDNIRLRSAAIELLAKQRDAILGRDAAILAKGFVGWRGGFADELRIQPTTVSRRNLIGLFGHPTFRFVRHVALGETHPDVIAAVARADLPLLDEVVASDRLTEVEWIEVPSLSQLKAPKLTLSGMIPTAPMPQLRALTVVGGIHARPVATWLARGGALNVATLTVIAGIGAPIAQEDLLLAVAGIPALRELVVIGIPGSIAPPRVAVTRIASPALYDPMSLGDDCWFLTELAARGRNAIRHAPGAGHILFNVATARLMAGDKHARECIPVLDASATLPAAATAPYQYANAAIAHERAGELDQAELRAREALIYSPREPNYHAILLDALRRTDRLADAARALPAAIRAIAKPLVYNQRGGREACLFDALLVLAQLGRHAEAIALAERFADAMKPEGQAVLAMSHLATGDRKAAQVAWRATKGSTHPVIHHARATLDVAMGKLVEARAALGRAKKARYNELHWVAVDPLLAPIRTPKRKPHSATA